MILRCPVCRADNTTGPACRRCKADLSLLIAVEERRGFLLARAQVAIRDSQLDEALELLGQATELRDGPDTHRLRACVFVMAGDHAAAFAEHAAATT